MSEKENKAVTNWLFIVCGLIMFMVVFGGYVRLTRSGLSIVEWNPVMGVIPPIGDAAWEQEFAKYQETPEFLYINKSMDLEGYKDIFYIEWFHRLIARFAGLIVVIPLFYFLYKGIIPWRESAVYLLIGLLFAFQGFLGWYMVSSGLRDVPAVSPFRLTIHLLMALLLLAIALWMALNHRYGFPRRVPGSRRTLPYGLSILMLVTLIIQISYGGFMAGLKAGHVSNTFPLMNGRLIPPGFLTQLEPWWYNLVAGTQAVHFIHRWFAFIVLVASIILYVVAKKRAYSPQVQKSLVWMWVLTALQVTLGVFVVWFRVPLILALSHQALALGLFVVAIYLTYRIVHEPVPYPGALEPQMALSSSAAG